MIPVLNLLLTGSQTAAALAAVVWVFYGYSKLFILNNSYFLYFCFGFWKQI